MIICPAYLCEWYLWSAFMQIHTIFFSVENAAISMIFNLLAVYVFALWKYLHRTNWDFQGLCEILVAFGISVSKNIFAICIYVYTYIHIYIYTLPAKNMEYFLFQRFFCIFVECAGCFCTWNTFPRADITFGGVNLHLTAKLTAKVQKQLFGYFSQLDYG